VIFGVDVSAEANWTVVRARGEVDLATSPRLRSALVDAAGPGPCDLVIDLSSVELIDSTGLGVLVGALRRARQTRSRLVLAGVGGQVEDVFALTGLDAIFDRAPSVADVVAAAGDDLKPAHTTGTRFVQAEPTA
jgi:anti-sigma B factor antagonist